MPPCSKKVLIITPHYSPAIRPRAFRWTAIAEGLARNGCQVYVLCSRHIERESGAEELNGVRIFRTGYNSLKEVYYHFFKVKNRRGAIRPLWEDEVENALKLVSKNATTRDPAGDFLKQFELADKVNKVSLTNRLLMWFNNTFWRSIYWPDDACVWYSPALRKAKKLWEEAGGFDTVISVSLPFTSHWITGKLRKAYDFKWIMDIGDPFFLKKLYPENNPFWYHRKNFRSEKEVLEACDAVSVTNELVKNAYADTFSIAASKIFVIPPISGQAGAAEITATLMRIKEIKKTRSSDMIHIGYFGSFFTKIRVPDDFLKLVGRWFELLPVYRNKVQLHFFGDIFDEFREVFASYSGLKDNMHFYGLVPREIVPVFMESMDILLNIGNQSNLHIPSKTADYIRSGKPILNFSYFKDDTFFDYVRAYLVCHNFDFSDRQIRDTEIRALAGFTEACRLEPGVEEESVVEIGENTSFTVLEMYKSLL